MAAFKLHFAAVQETFGKMTDCLGSLDADKADKARSAVRALLEKLLREV
jgi:hypothetical protein